MFTFLTIWVISLLVLARFSMSSGEFDVPSWLHHGTNHGRAHGHNFGDHDAGWNRMKGERDGYDHGWRGANAGHGFDEHASNAFDRGDHGWANGDRSRSDFDGDGHVHHAGEAASRAGEDAEGEKKFSYLSQGSGPEGFYSKGYFGSNGYGHEAGKAAESAESAGEGYAKSAHDRDVADAQNEHGHDASQTDHHFGDRGDERSGEWEARGAHDKARQGDGWRSEGSDNGWRAAHDHGEGHHPYAA